MRGTEEWDPWVANNRDLATMQRIALEATELGDDPWCPGRIIHPFEDHPLRMNNLSWPKNAIRARIHSFSATNPFG